MINYTYDGTFEGFLTVIAGANDSNEEVWDIAAGEINPDLFTEIKAVETDSSLADLFFQSLASQVSQNVILDIGYCFLSETRESKK